MISCSEIILCVNYMVHPYMLPHKIQSLGIPFAFGNGVTCTIAGFTVFLFKPILLLECQVQSKLIQSSIRNINEP
jgi:hypothetical protein